jgi:hypothetical protein
MLRPFLVARLFLSTLIAQDALIMGTGRRQLRLWHALLAAMLAAMISYAFQIVSFWHRDQTSFSRTPTCVLLQFAAPPPSSISAVGLQIWNRPSHGNTN